MRLLVSKASGNLEILSEETSLTQANQVINSLDWKEFNIVTLEKDENNWLDVSGNLGEDGLSVSYSKNKYVKIFDDSPTSVSQVLELVQLFYENEERLTSFTFELRPEVAPNNSHNKWKEKYEAQKKSAGKNLVLRTIGALIIVGLVGLFVYAFYTEELRFLGHSTDNTKAIVTKVDWQRVSGGYIQLVTYEFEWEGKKYSGHFKGTEFTGKHSVNDLVNVKFSLENPAISKRVYTYKKSDSD